MLTTPAHSQTLQPNPPKASPSTDLLLTTTALTLWLAVYRSPPSGVANPCPCDARFLNPLDRSLLSATTSPTAERRADLFAIASLSTTVLGLALQAPDLRSFASDSLLTLESVAFTGLSTQLIKHTAQRPYPYMFTETDPMRLQDPINYASLWSGHTATPMSAAVSLAWILHRRYPSSPWRWVAWTLGPSLALASGISQMQARNHFATDVLLGAAAGSTIATFNLRWH